MRDQKFEYADMADTSRDEIFFALLGRRFTEKKMKEVGIKTNNLQNKKQT